MGGRIRSKGRREGAVRVNQGCGAVTEGREFSLRDCRFVGFVDSVTFLCVDTIVCYVRCNEDV
jgi:hypothetical protein